jgi:hypothetical protein
MALPHVAPRRVAPYVISGASGAHILARFWRVGRAPARNAPLHQFLARHSDVMLILGSSYVAVWRLAKRHHQDNSMTNGHDTDRLAPAARHV